MSRASVFQDFPKVAGFVYAVVDVVDFEGRHVERIFRTREAAEKYAQENFRNAEGHMTVDEWAFHE